MQEFDNKLKRYKYSIALEVVFPDDPERIYYLEKNIQDILFTYNYIDNVMPIYQFKLAINHKIMTKFQLYPDDMKILFSLYRYELNNKTHEVVTDSKEDVIKKEELKAYNINRTPIPIEIEENDEEDNVYTNTNQNNYIMHLNCFMKKHLDVNKKLLHNITTNETLRDTILYLINQVPIENVIMQKPENTTVYEQIFIPPLNFTNTIKYLHKVYGIYKYGMRVFMDHRWSYILKVDKLDDKEKLAVPKPIYDKYDEWNTVIIDVVDPRQLTLDDQLGCYHDEELEHDHIKLVDQLVASNSDTSLREIFGEDIRFLSRNKEDRFRMHGDKNLFNLQNSGPRKDKEVSNSELLKQNFYWNNYANDYSESEMISDAANEQMIANLRYEDIDINMIMLNRKYQLNYSNKIYDKILSGNYILRSNVIKIIKDNDGTYYTLAGNLTLGKLNKDYFV